MKLPGDSGLNSNLIRRSKNILEVEKNERIRLR